MNGLRDDGMALARALAIIGAAAGRELGCELLVCPPATLLSDGGRHSRRKRHCARRPGLPCRAQGRLHRRHQRRDAGGSRLQPRHPRAFRAPPGSWRNRCGRSRQDCRRVASRVWWRSCASAKRTQQRQGGTAVEIVSAQLAGSIPDGCHRRPAWSSPTSRCWAIGTGLTATFDDIAAMHAEIRSRIPSGTRILYGGSVNPKNAAAILSLCRGRRRAGRRRQPQRRGFLGDRAELQLSRTG